MPKSIAVLGVGPGLGQAVAHRYAADGYTVALVARSAEPLDRIASELSSAGAHAHALAADLSDPVNVPALAAEIRARVGELDALYYGPTPGGLASAASSRPARPSELTPERIQAYMPMGVHTLVALVQEFLPHMIEQQRGAIMVAAGASAVRGVPYFSAPGPALAAQRNYMQSLEAELAGTGVFVGRLYIGATIKNSAWHKRLQAMQAAGTPTDRRDAIIDPDDLADIVWNMHHTTKQPETLYPEGIFDR